MADFPLNPSVGDVFVASDFTSWFWDGYSWRATNFGLPKVPTSANSGGMLLPNSINLINTSTIFVGVSAGIDGNANLSFSSNLEDPLETTDDQIIFNGPGTITGSDELKYNLSSNTLTVNTSLFYANGVTGNVGIGTTNPGYKLDVIGTVNVHSLRVANANSILWSNHDLTTDGAKIQVTADTMYIETGPVGPGRGALYVTAHNNMQVGTDGGFIDLRATAAGDGSYIHFRTGGTTERMRIDHQGNVGIGTTNPTAKLHVSGRVMIDDGDGTELIGGGRLQLVSGYASPVSGRVIMGDGTGWQMHVSRKTGAGALDDLYTFTDQGIFYATSAVNTEAVYETSTGIEAFAMIEATRTVNNTQNTNIATAANTARVHANGTLLVSNANLNFVSSTTANAEPSSNGSASNPSQANITFSVNAAAINVMVGPLINAAANTVRVSASGGSTTAKANGLNFNNTSSVQVVVESGINGNVNVSFTTTETGGSSVGDAYNAANTAANNAANSANTVAVFANGTIVLSKANVNFNNTANINVVATANGTNQTNVSFVLRPTINISTLNVTSIVGQNTTISLTGALGTAFDIETAASSNANLTLGANGVEIIRLTNTARVGIGTTAPNSNLVLLGNAWITSALNVTGTINVTTGNVTGGLNVAGTANVTNMNVTSGFNVAATMNASTINANTIISRSTGINVASQAELAFANANSAANTVRLSLDAGSVQVKSNGINFKNTSSVRVAFAAGSSGNTDVTFEVIGVSGAQGALLPVGNDGDYQYKASSTTLANSNTHLTLDTTRNVLRMQSNIADTPVVSLTGSIHCNENAAGKVFITGNNVNGAVTNANAMTIVFANAAYAGFAITVIRGGTSNATIANLSLKSNSASFTRANISNQWEAATIMYKATNEIVLLGSID